MNIYCAAFPMDPCHVALRAAVAAYPTQTSVLASFHFYGVGAAGTHTSCPLANVTDGPVGSLFLDSGAYSALSVGVRIDHASYRRWAFSTEASLVAGPDVIGDPDASARETEKMLSEAPAGFCPILPVFHVGEDWAWLERACAMSDYIALGGMVPHSSRRRALAAWIGECFRRIPIGTRVHGFGCTSWDLVRGFPWASVDSSSWMSPGRYGKARLFQNGWWHSIDPRAPRTMLQRTELMRHYGIDPLELACLRDGKVSMPMITALMAACAMSNVEAEQWLNRSQK